MPAAAFPSPALRPATTGSARGAAPQDRSPGAVTRRRRALLKLARRHGEVRLQLGTDDAVAPGAADVSELLDGLNEDGLLRYGGLRAAEGGRELLYLIA